MIHNEPAGLNLFCFMLSCKKWFFKGFISLALCSLCLTTNTFAAQKSVFVVENDPYSGKKGKQQTVCELNDLSKDHRSYMKVDLSSLGPLKRKGENKEQKALSDGVSHVSAKKLVLVLASDVLEIRPHQSVKDLAIKYMGGGASLGIENTPLYLGQGVSRLCVSSDSLVSPEDFLIFSSRLEKLNLASLILDFKMSHLPRYEAMAKTFGATSLKYLGIRFRGEKGRMVKKKTLLAMGQVFGQTMPQTHIVLSSGNNRFVKKVKKQDEEKVVVK